MVICDTIGSSALTTEVLNSSSKFSGPCACVVDGKALFLPLHEASRALVVIMAGVSWLGMSSKDTEVEK